MNTWIAEKDLIKNHYKLKKLLKRIKLRIYY